MTDNPENHSSATKKPKRGRKPKKQQAIEAENTALAKIVADFEALKGQKYIQEYYPLHSRTS